MTVFTIDRDRGPRPKPLPAIEGAKVTDLAEYRDEADRRGGMVPSMLFDGLGPDPTQRPLDADQANYVAGELQDLLQGARSIARATKDREPAELHVWAEAKAREIEFQLVQLAGMGGDAA